MRKAKANHRASSPEKLVGDWNIATTRRAVSASCALNRPTLLGQAPKVEVGCQTPHQSCNRHSHDPGFGCIPERFQLPGGNAVYSCIHECPRNHEDYRGRGRWFGCQVPPSHRDRRVRTSYGAGGNSSHSECEARAGATSRQFQSDRPQTCRNGRPQPKTDTQGKFNVRPCQM